MTTRVAVLVSGTGRHLENFASLARSGELDIEVGLVISNKTGVRALEHAARFELEALVLDPSRELDDATFGREAFAAIEAAGCELVLLAGFLRKLDVPESWAGRVLNIHPSLLPSFPGLDPHGQALRAGVKLSGATVHFVIPETDAGPIVMQGAVPVSDHDTADTLSERILEVEHRIYPEALRLLALGKIRIEGDVCRTAGSGPSENFLVAPVVG